MQLRIRHIARSVLSNWFATAATLAAGFFLAPFIVHHLGNVAYGVWVLAVSAVNYMAILDLGMASSVVRFVSKGYTTQDHEGASEVLSAVLWVRLQIGLLVLLVTGCLAVVFPLVFKVPAALALDARKAILIIGVTSVISMSFGAFSSVLTSLNRFDLKSYVTLTQLTLRVAGVVTVLRSGHGIVAIAFCELFAASVSGIMQAYIARKTYPELRVQIKKPRREVIRKIWSYSLYAFLITIAGQLVYQSDNLVVGAFVSTTAVTFYSIGNSLCRYTSQLFSAMTTTFTPAASTYESAGNTDSLRALYYNGTRVTLALSLPVVITLLTRGRNFISVWMGPQYSKTSGTVLIILASALLFALQNSTIGSIAWGVEKHKKMAHWAIGEAIANLTLSIILAKMYGIYGVAIGTLIPNLFVQIVLWPRYVSKIVDVSYIQVFRNVWGPIFLSAVPFAAASYAVGVHAPARNIAMFFLQTIALLPVFFIFVAWTFMDNIKRQILPKIRSCFYANAM